MDMPGLWQELGVRPVGERLRDVRRVESGVSYTLAQIEEITNEQYRPWAKDLRGAHVLYEDVVERRWNKYVCGRCWESVYRDPYAMKQRGSAIRYAAWIHKITGVRWCKPD